MEGRGGSYTSLCLFFLIHGRTRLVPTNRGEFSGAERTRDVVYVGRRQDLSISALTSSFLSICNILFTCSYSSSSSLEKRDRGRRRGGGGEDGFAIDCGQRERECDHEFSIMESVRTLNILPVKIC